MSENGWLVATALESILLLRVNEVCPVKSENTCGLILSARGGRFFDKREVEDIVQYYSRLELQKNKKPPKENGGFYLLINSRYLYHSLI